MNNLSLILFQRQIYRTNDLWGILETNWTHFFWLTGETPATLQIIVNRIQTLFRQQVNLGRPQILDFRNQVSF